MDNAFFMFNAPSKLGKPTNIAEHNKRLPENNLLLVAFLLVYLAIYSVIATICVFTITDFIFSVLNYKNLVLVV